MTCWIRSLGISLMLVAANCFPCWGQSVDMVTISSTSFSGNEHGVGLSVTIGEPISATFAVSQIVLTQGFEQPDSGIITRIPVIVPKANISFFPNPVDDRVFISSDEAINVCIYDLNGKLLISHSCIADALNLIDIGSLSSGMYLLSFISERTVIQSSKFVKQ